MRWLFIGLITFYRWVISPIMPGKCRYYPTCSAYAMTNFKHAPWWEALGRTLLRILRCNQLFEGGIDYPKVPFKAPSRYKKVPYITKEHPWAFDKPREIQGWLIPINHSYAYYIEHFKEERNIDGD